MSIRCVAFDLDGVVIPADPSFILFEREHGITREQWGEFFMGDYRSAMAGECDLFDVLPDVIAGWGWTGSVEAFARTWFESCDRCDADAANLIRELASRDILCCAASNQDNRRAVHLDSVAEIAELLPRRFFSCRLGTMKPEPAYFRAVEADLGLTGEQILFVDDKPENVAGARHCGWRADHVATPSRLRDVVSRHIDLSTSRSLSG